MKRWRLWRVRRAYRRIAILEVRAGEQAFVLRAEFAQDTLRLLDSSHKSAGVNRAQRRQWKRALVR